MKHAVLLGGCLAVATAATAPAQIPTDVYVSASGSDTPPYTNWAMAAHAIGSAIQQAGDGTTIHVTNGTYGAYYQPLGAGTEVVSVNGPLVTIIDGQGWDPGFQLDHPDAVLDGFTIKNGIGGGVRFGVSGGTARNCMIVSNAAGAGNNGGGVYFGGAGQVENCEIRDNTSFWHAAGVYFEGGGSIRDSVIEDNVGQVSGQGHGLFLANGGYASNCTIAGHSGGRGGAVYLEHSGHLVDCTVSNNTAVDRGPIHVAYGGTVEECLVVDNVGVEAGGIFLDTGGAVIGTTVVSNRTVSAVNYDDDAGGIQVWSGGSVSNCSIVGNTGGEAGGITMVNVTSALVDCDILDNVGTNAGGVWVQSDHGVVSNCTVRGNVALGPRYENGSHGGLYLDYGAVVDSRIVGNRGEDSGGIYLGFDAQGAFDCVVQSNTTGGEGGGIYAQSSAPIERCTIQGNRADQFGGVYTRSYLLDCLVIDNYGTNWCGGAAAAAATNVVIAGNVSGASTGGFRPSSGSAILENCTIAHNTAVYNYGGVDSSPSDVLRNCIIVENEAADHVNYRNRGQVFEHCLSTPTPPGTGSITGTPLFIHPASRDYRLRNLSPGLDAGTNQAWMAAGTDLAGDARIVNGIVDIGAYEQQVAGTVRCTFSGTPLAGRVPFAVVFSSTISNAAPGSTWYTWDLDFDSVPDVEGFGLVTVTNLYAATGVYGVSLTVSNAAAGTDTEIRASYVQAFAATPATHYVSPTGGDVSPYTSWATAARAVENAAAVSFDGDSIVVSNSTYLLGATVAVRSGVTMSSVNGQGAAILDGQDARGCIRMHAGSVVDGFTLRNGRAASGAGAYLDGGGTIRNCTITNHTSTGTTAADGGGGIYATGGTIEDCLIGWNTSAVVVSSSAGGGARLEGACLVSNCVIIANSSREGGGLFLTNGPVVVDCTLTENEATSQGGGGIKLWGSGSVGHCTIVSNRASNNLGGGLRVDDPAGVTVRNCLLAGNEAFHAGGFYVYPQSAGQFSMESCTVATNTALGFGGGTYYHEHHAIGITNTIVRGNTDSSGYPEYYDDYGAIAWSHSCTTPDPGEPGNTAGDPLFVDPAQGNYRIDTNSACFNTGLDEPWMPTAVDLDGNPRLWGDRADMGAYEVSYPWWGLDLDGTPVTGDAPLEVVFTATTIGADSTNLYYAWDFEDDGTPDLAGSDIPVVSNTYLSAGVCDVSLTVSNAVDSDTKTVLHTNYITVSPPPFYYYVSPSGANTPPYTNWAMAAHAIQDAVDLAMDRDHVVVTDGTYVVTSPVVLSNRITLESVNGPAVTVIDGGGTNRVLEITNANAVVHGVTLTHGYDGNLGGAVVLHGTGVIDRCIVTASETAGGGGGIYCLDGGTVRNTLVHGNRAAWGGGIECFALSSGALIESCTVAGNTAHYEPTSGGVGGGVRSVNQNVIRNCIIYGNTADDGSDMAYSIDTNFSNLCTPVPIGANPVTNDPLFAFAAFGDYAPMPGSPCIDAGASIGWMAGAMDVAGNPRIAGAQPDIGAHEYPDGPVWCTFTALPIAGHAPLTVDFTATVAGSNTTGLTYYWDLDGDASWDLVGAAHTAPSYTYGVGTNTVTLQVRNTVGDTYAVTRRNLVVGVPGTIHVTTNGAHAYPYDTWPDAATNLHSAVNAAVDGTEIVVSNGLHLIDSELVVDKTLTLRSVNGPSHTMIRPRIHYDHRCLVIDDPGVVVDGFELTYGGRSGAGNYGGGIYFNADGLVRNCVVSWSQAVGGGGVYFDHAGRLEETVVEHCDSGRGAGAWLDEGGMASNCTFRYNQAYWNNPLLGDGGGAYVDDGHMVNCFIYENKALETGAGVVMLNTTNALLLNCTIVSNTHFGGAFPGGLWTFGPVVIRNTIIVSNGIDNVIVDVGPSTFDHCISDEFLTGSGNLVGEPQLIAAPTAPYRIGAGSPCVDAGTATGAPGRDHDGIPRPLDGDGSMSVEVDIGASEYAPPAQDSDGDGISDFDEVHVHGTNPLVEDTDGDGLEDNYELIAGSDPTDPDDAFMVDGASTAPGGGGFVVAWDTLTGRLYTLRTTMSLVTTWSNVTGFVEVPGTGAAMAYTNNAPVDGQYFAVEVRLAP